MHRARHHATALHAPWLVSIPLEPGYQEQALLIVHPDRAVAPAEGLSEVLGFEADGRGGWIAAARTAHGWWGYIDGEGRWCKAATLQKACSFYGEDLAAFSEGGRWGFVDLSGEVAMAPVFQHAHPFRDGACTVQVDRRAWRIVDRHGLPLCDAFFGELGPLGAHGLARAAPSVAPDGHRAFGFVDRQGQWVIEPRFRQVRSFGEADTAAASLDGVHYGLIDTAGRWVLPPRYACIDDFNADGLAFFAEAGAWDHGYGYLDTQGRVVIEGGRHLSRHMACAVAAHSDHGARFLTRGNQPLPGPDWSYGTDFSADRGFAVVRTATPQDSGPAPGTPAAAPAVWGLLHPDGRFVPAPAHLLEPLTDGEGGLVAAQPGTPLVPFITRDGQMAFIDGEGAEVWRAHYDGQQVALLNAQGGLLWRSGVRDLCWPPRPFFQAPFTDHLEGLQTLEGIVPLAQRLLARAQAPQTPPPDPLGEGPTDRSTEGSRCRVLHAYLSASHSGPYPFLAAQLRDATGHAFAALAQHLSARFGAPVRHPLNANAMAHPDGVGAALAWAVPQAQPHAAESTAAGTPAGQWLTLCSQAQTCDGDAWWELWLEAVPRREAPPSAHPTQPAHGATLGAQGLAAAAHSEDGASATRRMTQQLLARRGARPGQPNLLLWCLAVLAGPGLFLSVALGRTHGPWLALTATLAGAYATVRCPLYQRLRQRLHRSLRLRQGRTFTPSDRAAPHP